MKRFLFILNLLLCIGSAAQAQTYTQHLQEKKQGKANVTVTQSREIETLVNGANVSARKPAIDNHTTNNAHKTDNAPIKKQNNQEQAQQKHTANPIKAKTTTTPTANSTLLMSSMPTTAKPKARRTTTTRWKSQLSTCARR